MRSDTRQSNSGGMWSPLWPVLVMVLCGGCSSPFVNAEDVHPVIVRESPRNLRVRPEVVSQLQALPEIPHKLHIIWPDREVVFKKDEMVLHGIRKMIDLNPEWTYTVYNHDDIDNYLKKELTRESPVLSQSDIDLMMTAHIVERTDAARLLMMWHEGGFYQDVDRIYNVPMSDVLTPGVKMVLQTLYEGTFMQDQMCTAPGNPIVMRAITVAWEMRRRVVRVDGFASFGDHMMMVNSWTLAIRLELFGNMSVPMSDARAAIELVPTLKTNNEEWCDGLWIRSFKDCKNISRAKLYEDYHIEPWGYVVKQVWKRHCDELRTKVAADPDQDYSTRLLEFQCNLEDHMDMPDITPDPTEIDPAVAQACQGFVIRNQSDVSGAVWIESQPSAGHQAKPRVCCGLCASKPTCKAWVVQPSTSQCWLMKAAGEGAIGVRTTPDRVAGVATAQFAVTSAMAVPTAVSQDVVVGPTLIKQLEALPAIPKRLHIIFPSKDVVNSNDKMVLHGLRNMIDMNPDWTYTVYDHNDIDSYIKRELSRESPTLNARDVELVLKAHIVERTDAARLLMMWHEGGFYQDVDRLYNVPMDRVLTPEVKMVIPTLYDTNFMQDLMCTAPGNPIVKRAIQMAWEWRRTVPRVRGIANFADHMMMVNSWSTALSVEIFGRASVGIKDARDAIEKVSSLKTYKEEWCDGLWIRPFSGCKEVSRADLYTTFNISPWGNEVKDLWKMHCTKIASRLRKLKLSTSTSEGKAFAIERLTADWQKYTCFRDEHRPDHMTAADAL